MEATAQLLHSVETKEDPCRVLYLPAFDSLLAACYTYDKSTKKRQGSLELFDT